MKILKLRIAQSPLTPTKKTEVPILPKRGLKEIKSKKLRALHQKTKKKWSTNQQKPWKNLYTLKRSNVLCMIKSQRKQWEASRCVWAPAGRLSGWGQHRHVGLSQLDSLSLCCLEPWVGGMSLPLCQPQAPPNGGWSQGANRGQQGSSSGFLACRIPSLLSSFVVMSDEPLAWLYTGPGYGRYRQAEGSGFWNLLPSS